MARIYELKKETPLTEIADARFDKLRVVGSLTSYQKVLYNYLTTNDTLVRKVQYVIDAAKFKAERLTQSQQAHGMDTTDSVADAIKLALINLVDSQF